MDDEVVVLRGVKKGFKGKVIQVYRKKWVIHIDKLTKNKANGAPYQLPVHPSKVAITKVKEGKDRLAKIKLIAAGVDARKGKADKKIRTTN
jgi:large subunit ribosomal protein L26e